MNDKNKNTSLEATNQSVRDSNSLFEGLKTRQSEEFKGLVRQHRLGHESIKSQLADVSEMQSVINREVDEALAYQNLAFEEVLGNEKDPLYREAAARARQLLQERAELDSHSQELRKELLHPIGNYEKPQTLSWEEAMAIYRQVRAEDDIDIGEIEGDVTMIDVLYDVTDDEKARATDWRHSDEGRRRNQEEDPLKTASRDILSYIAHNEGVTVTGREIGLEIYSFRDDVGKDPNRRAAALKAGSLVASSMSAGRGDQLRQARKLYEDYGLYLQVGKRQFIRDGKVINGTGLNVYRAVRQREGLPSIVDIDNGRIVYRDMLADVVLLGEAEYDRLAEETNSTSVDKAGIQDEELVKTEHDNSDWEAEFRADVSKVIEQMMNDHIFEQDYMNGGAIRAMSATDIGTRPVREALLKAKHLKSSEAGRDGMTRRQRVIASLIGRWPELTMARGKDKYKHALRAVDEAIENNLKSVDVA